MGLVKNYKGAINSKEANDSTTAIYNFEFDEWTLQDSLTYKDILEASISIEIMFHFMSNASILS